MAPADPRVHIQFRIGQRGKDWVDEMAEKYHTTRSEVLRVALAVARMHPHQIDERLKAVSE